MARPIFATRVSCVGCFILVTLMAWVPELPRGFQVILLAFGLMSWMMAIYSAGTLFRAEHPTYARTNSALTFSLLLLIAGIFYSPSYNGDTAEEMRMRSTFFSEPSFK